MSFYVRLLFSYSIFIPGIIALIRFKKIYFTYYPFLICLAIGCVNEVLSTALVLNHHSNVLDFNIYVLVESILLTVLFKTLGIFKMSKTIFIAIITSLIIFWVAETLAYVNIIGVTAYFRVFYSFIIVLMSVTALNKIIADNRKINAAFLLCIAFTIYFTFKILVYSFWIGGVSDSFLLKISIIMQYIDLLTNLIYAIAVLWMPRKQEFSLPY